MIDSGDVVHGMSSSARPQMASHAVGSGVVAPSAFDTTCDVLDLSPPRVMVPGAREAAKLHAASLLVTLA